MSFQVKILADSYSAQTPATRLTTFEVVYPRFVHAELMTHRVFSRNASSSRAIPVNRMVQMALDDPADFVFVGKNIPGMQANEQVDADIQAKFRAEWRELAHISARYALRWANEYNIHKQTVNRAMEPWHHIKVVVTSTSYENFFALRCHPMAQPEIRALADLMHIAYTASVPQRLERGEWHLPYIQDQERDQPIQHLLMVSAARCARTSYFAHDGALSSFEKDMELCRTLCASEPLHASPLEHQASTAVDTGVPSQTHGNLAPDWVQFRKLVEAAGLDTACKMLAQPAKTNVTTEARSKAINTTASNTEIAHGL